MFSRLRSLVGAASAAALVLVIAGCAGDVPMQPAEGANDPACADVIVRLPQTVGGLEKRTTNAQSTGAWGDPAAVELRCGIEPSGPTTDDCVSVDGVDWVIDDSQKPIFRFEAYGRSPGLEVFVDSREVSGTDVALDLNGVAQQLPQQRQCTSVADTLEGDPRDDLPE